MRGHEQQFAERGAQLVFVGPGTPAMAAAFRDDQQLSCPVLSDPSRDAFTAAGMKRGVLATFHWRTILHGLRALFGGFLPARVQGDPWQQGGALVFDATGTLRYQWHDRAGGDQLDLPALLEATT